MMAESDVTMTFDQFSDVVEPILQHCVEVRVHAKADSTLNAAARLNSSWHVAGLLKSL